MRPSTAILVVGAAALALWYVTKQKATTARPLPSPTGSSTMPPQATTPATIEAAGKAVGSVVGAIGGLFND